MYWRKSPRSSGMLLSKATTRLLTERNMNGSRDRALARGDVSTVHTALGKLGSGRYLLLYTELAQIGFLVHVAPKGDLNLFHQLHDSFCVRFCRLTALFISSEKSSLRKLPWKLSGKKPCSQPAIAAERTWSCPKRHCEQRYVGSPTEACAWAQDRKVEVMVRSTLLNFASRQIKKDSGTTVFILIWLTTGD